VKFQGGGLNQTAAFYFPPVVCARACHIDTIKLEKQKSKLYSPPCGLTGKPFP
jgi:hypothetical protein